jgi:predicted acetyltransferase
MSDIVVRRFEEGDREGFNRIRSMTYRGGKPVLDHENLLPDDCIGYVAVRDDFIPGAYTAIDMTATRGETTFECAGVCAVGVLPEERRSGVGSVLMTEGLRLMKEEGYQLASLYAYRESYYRKFGYECCGSSYEILCPLDRLPKVKPTLPIRQLSPDEFALLRPCYTSFAHRYSGMNTRAHERFWPKADAEPPTVYVAGDPIEAYVVARLDPTFWNEQPIRELVWNTIEGYEACLSLFYGYAINKSAVRWTEPGDSPFMAAHLDQGVEVKAGKNIMFRVLDVRACLEALPSPRDGEFVLKVDDLQLPENAGPWLVECCGGRVSVSPASGLPDLQMNVKQFAQALLGEPSLADLLRIGLVEVGRPVAVEMAAALLKPNPTTCVDSF